MAETIIREALREESSSIRALVFEAYREYTELMEPGAWAGLREAIERGLENGASATTLVAESDGRLAGSVQLYPAGVDAYAGAVRALDRPEVRLLAVAPWARGRGIGEALMRECIHRARAAGAREIGIHTSKSMRSARELYRRMGFQRLSADDFQPAGGELVEAHVLRLEG